ncbi:MAG: phosphate ABC transporter permease PstA [Evtepia sp.]
MYQTKEGGLRNDGCYPKRRSPRAGEAYDRNLRTLLYVCAGITVALLVFLIGYIFYRGLSNISWSLLTSQTSYISDTIGILPNFLNTLYIILLAMVIVLPLGVGAAIYLTEYATNRNVVAIIEFATETLTGIPSIIFGLVGMLFFLQLMGLKAGILAGGLTLVIMILPTIVRTTQESLKTVPQSYREGSLALGAGKWHMVRTVVLPNAVDGIVTGCILAIGRIVGESAALLFTAGFGLELNNFLTSMQASSATLTVALYVYANERGETGVAFAIAAVLMILVLVINFSATFAGRKLKRKAG